MKQDVTTYKYVLLSIILCLCVDNQIIAKWLFFKRGCNNDNDYFHTCCLNFLTSDSGAYLSKLFYYIH